MAGTSRFVVLLALAVTLPLAGAAVENDGGSGGDAPNSPSNAYPVPHGTWSGYLGNNADWYRVGTVSSEPLCVTVGSGPGDADADLEARFGTTTVTGDGNAGADGTLLVDGGQTLLLGLRPTQNPATNTPSRPGTYTITTAARSVADLGRGDAGTGGDVDGALSGAHTLSQPCVAGHVQPVVDVRDSYSFTGTAGNVVRLSYLQLTDDGTTRLALLDPDQATVTALTDGVTRQVTLAKTGTYLVTVTIPELSGSTTQTASSHGGGGALDDISYMFGFDIDDPGPQPCRPNCF